MDISGATIPGLNVTEQCALHSMRAPALLKHAALSFDGNLGFPALYCPEIEAC